MRAGPALASQLGFGGFSEPGVGMWAEPSGVAIGVALTGFGMVLFAYLSYAAHLRRAEQALSLPATPSSLPRSMMVAVLASAAWGAAGLADVLSSKLLAWHLSVVFDHLRYAAWSAFLLLLLQPMVSGEDAPWWWRLRTVGPLILLMAGAGANLVLALPGGPPQAALQALAAVQLAWAVSGLVLVEQVFRNQGDSSRWAAKPLCLGLACLFIYDLYLYAQGLMFGVPDRDVVNARPLVHAAAVPLLLVASRRNARWLASVRVSTTAAFYSASLLLVGAYLLFVAAAGYYVKFFGGTWGGALQVALMATAVLMLAGLVLSAAQRARVRVFLNKHFFRYRYDYRVEWLRFTSMLSSRATPQEVNLQVVRGLADLVESTAGSLWFKSLGNTEYVQSASWNMPQVAAGEPIDSAFSCQMRENEWIIDFTAASPGPLHSPPWLPGAGPAWLAIPLLVGGEMSGFVLLGPPRTPIELNWEVRDLLKTAARQAAGFLALMHATEALIETRKFDAFNRMSAFVVHDLKNIITQLSLMLKNAERHRDNPEFQQDMLMTVANSLEKMKQMMMQLREGERPEGVASGVELAPILNRLGAAARRSGREVEVKVVERLSTRGHEQRLERVIDHVVQNALDATPISGSVWVKLDRRGGRAAVVIGDTGAGMSQDFIRDRLFRPFNSTKSHGMGIGSYESFQYLRELGGDIEVQSEVGKGTVVTLMLPLFEHRVESDLTFDPT